MLELAPGDPLLLEQTNSFNWAEGTVLSVESNGWYRGDYEVLANGSLSDVIPVQNVIGMTGGFNFEVEVEPFVPHVDPGKSAKQRLRRRRIKQVAATLAALSGGRDRRPALAFYRSGENEEQRRRLCATRPIRGASWAGTMIRGGRWPSPCRRADNPRACDRGHVLSVRCAGPAGAHLAG